MIIQPDHVPPGLKQSLSNMESDETGGAGN
jgi:hypothetical protein